VRNPTGYCPPLKATKEIYLVGRLAGVTSVAQKHQGHEQECDKEYDEQYKDGYK